MILRRIRRSTRLGLVLLLAVGSLAAQDTSRRPLEIADYQLWRTISDADISSQGSWVAWTYSRVRGDDTLSVQSIVGDGNFAIPRGSDGRFSRDGAWIAFTVVPDFREVERLEREGDPVLRQAGLMHLATGEIRMWDDAEEFGFSESSSHFYVKKRKSDGDAEHDGTDLILRNLARGFEELIGSVNELEFNDDGTRLAFTVDAEGGDGNGLYIVDLSTGARVGIDNSKERYSRLTWAENGNALAVLRGVEPEGMVERVNRVVAFVGFNEAEVVRYDVLADATGLPAGSVLSEKGEVVFNEDASILFVGTKAQEAELEDWSDEDLPLADVNIWHWQDDRIQSAQQRQLESDKDRTYVAAVHLGEGRIVQLADERMRDVLITQSGRWGVGRDAQPYVSDWQPAVADYYRIDTRTGEREPVLSAHLRTLGLSPDSEHFLYWKEGDVWDYQISENRHRNLTASSSADFTDREYDRFGEKPPHGVAGWAAEGAGVLLYDKYDLWLQPFDGRAAENLTGGAGAAGEIRLRYVETDPEAETVELDEPLLLEAYGEWTKKEGFFELNGSRLTELAWEDRRFSTPVKALDIDRYLFTTQTFREFPDLWVTDGDFADRLQVTFANPQQDEFLWGRRILFDYTTDDGIPLQGTLAIPDTYVEGDKLPMVVRFYEKYSQDLHLYPTPVYRHQPNFAGLVSNGYLLMQPDIHFRIGSSHSDMLEAVEAATRKVIEMGYADPDAVGLSGHSYSGGGSAYIATRSDMFAAVAHGAAPINLVSEFNQLFVGNGENNHSYDIYGQGRYATNPYDDFERYWDQSPISGVENMNTPVLYLHGEEDPTVNWEQGLEWYNALRFLQKPIIWLSYPDEGHGLRKLQNRVDFQYRLQDFFNHHLKGMPAPAWMTDGVPQLEKDRHLRDYAPRIFQRRLIG